MTYINCLFYYLLSCSFEHEESQHNSGKEHYYYADGKFILSVLCTQQSTSLNNYNVIQGIFNKINTNTNNN